MMGIKGWPLADMPEVLTKFSALSSSRRADLLAFAYSEGASATAPLPAPPADGAAVPAIITSADSTGRALRPA
jgi:hypothetical protein